MWVPGLLAAPRVFTAITKHGMQIAPSLVTHCLNTPSDVTIGSFARECQIFHIVGRVLRNVHEPTPDEAFQISEAGQLEATMAAFVPLLCEDGDDFGKYCISFAVCSRYIP